ncbi:Cytochrome P450 4V2 [Eumeta japonica]|uniref:Cytochrome P450 4V2 n=1 Tax=Eumeta variegata TaxID=151549 RepID=A0A4C1V2V6_EUMVA|nr:Cytochrome P450 4V2 [Eumeta japonica]
MPRVLDEDDILNILLEDIPFDGESVCSFESDDENNYARENDLMVFGDLSSELQPQFDSDFDSDDDIPLSNLCTASANSISLTTQTEVVQPKWRKYFKMEKPCEYMGGGGVTNDIVELENITPTNGSECRTVTRPGLLGRTRRHKERPFRAFLDLMLELTAKEGIFTEQEIREEVDTIIVAGQETIGYTLLFTLLLLGTHQKQQQKVYDEIREIFGNGDRDVTKEDLANLIYLDAILKETTRIYPVSALLVRKVERDLKLNDYTLPAGSSCAVSVWGLHRHERWGPDYVSFRPERWLDAGALPAHPAAFAAFGYGRRGCVGKSYAFMSMKIMMVHVLRRYRVFSDTTDLEMKFDSFLKPIYGHLLKLEKR